MKAGISTASLFQREYTEDALALFDKWGVACAEVFFTSYSEYEPCFARLLKEKKGSVEVSSVHDLTMHFEPQLFSDQTRVKADAYAILDKIMQSARILGAEYYTFHGIARYKRTFQENVARTGAFMREIFAFCQKYGVTLCQENVEWAFYNRPGIFKKLKEFCPDLKGVLDLKQARLSGYDYREYLNEMGENLVTVHVSDVDENGNMCLPGRGTFDFDELFMRLADVGFAGSVLIENYKKDFHGLEELFASYKWLAEKTQKY